jgi:uncharacterized membrane protein
MNGLNDFAIARALHVLAIVIWIGGVAFVTVVLLPACREVADATARIALFEQMERRFAAFARGSVLLAGVSGLWMVWRLALWSRFAEPAAWWWMSAMVAIWALFALLLFVLEPLVLHQVFHRMAQRNPDQVFARIERLHRVLLSASLVTVLGAVAGSHGGWTFG